jgi:hypothetical protein
MIGALDVRGAFYSLLLNPGVAPVSPPSNPRGGSGSRIPETNYPAAVHCDSVWNG